MRQMEDAQHMAKFSHLYPDLPVRAMDVHRLKKQPFDYYLVLDLEGMVEILEFPIIMIDARTLKVVDRFHRYTPYHFVLCSCSVFYSLPLCVVVVHHLGIVQRAIFLYLFPVFSTAFLSFVCNRCLLFHLSSLINICWQSVI